jgi:transposase
LIYDKGSSGAYQGKEGSLRQLAKRFKVSLSFVRDLTRRHRELGTIEPKPHGGGAVAKINTAHLPLITTMVNEQPDVLLIELCDRFAQKTDIEVSISTMHRTIQSLNLTVKKNINCLRARNSKSQRLAIQLSRLEFHDRSSESCVHR